MPASPKDLFDRLAALGIATRTVEHPPLFTVEESRRLRGALPGGHCKSLFLRDKKERMFLLVALEDCPIDLKVLPELLQCGRLSFGSPERLMRHLGVRPGAVTPFALINDTAHQVALALQQALLAADPLNFHPLVNTLTTAIAPGDLLRFFQATGHPPRMLAL
ncbi:MAG: prolyl-tRNA synthetase associated domain-containing protein [Alphaproteobacteria bacterium]|nr:prolyl-tRNA synthetase associated domain-containing protein [Alphaproteobacteria bacterium]